MKKAVFHLEQSRPELYHTGTALGGARKPVSIGPKITKPRRSRAARTEPFMKKKEREKTWLQERTEHFEVIQRVVEDSFTAGCIQMGPDKTLRLGRVLGAGMFGSVFAAKLVDPPLTIDVAVKLMFDSGPDPRLNMFREAQIATTVSSSVLRGETPHFLLSYGNGYCREIGIPRGLDLSEEALQDLKDLQRRKDTAAQYLSQDDNNLLLQGRYDMLNFDLRVVFTHSVDIKEFRLDLYHYLRKKGLLRGLTRWSQLVLSKTPETIPFSVHVMEQATYSMVDFIVKEDPRTVHDVVGQIFQAAKDFYDITSYIHTDLHLQNVMVLRRGARDVPEYVLVMIDFGLTEPAFPIVSPDAFMVSVFLDSVEKVSMIDKIGPDLVLAIQGLIASPAQFDLIEDPMKNLKTFESDGPSSSEKFAMGMGQMGVELGEEIHRIDVKLLSEIWASFRP